MTDNDDFRTQPMQQPAWPASEAPPSHYAALPVPGQAPMMAPYGFAPDLLESSRSTGTCFLLCIVTFGFFTPLFFWFYKTHEEMKRHTGTGLAAGWVSCSPSSSALSCTSFTPSEVARHVRASRNAIARQGVTGLWALLFSAGSSSLA